MKRFQLSLLLLILGLYFPLSAQVPGIIPITKPLEAERKRQMEIKLAEQILVDARSLKLPQDRAYVFSKTGEYFCKNGNNELAKEIFEKSIKELIAAQNRTKETDGSIYESLLYSFFPRNLIIQSISNCDAELAYKYLYESRSQKLTEILNRFYQNPSPLKENSVASNALNKEIQREASIKLMIARKNPERFEELINKDIKTSLSYYTVDSLKSLHKTNPALANELMEKAVEKLLQLQFYDNETKKLVGNGYFFNFLIATSFVRAIGEGQPNKERPLTISYEALKKLTDKISKVIIDGGPDWYDENLLSNIQRFFPERFMQIAQIRADKKKSPEYLENQRYAKIVKSGVSNKEILAAAESFSEKNKNKVFKIAACRLVEEEKFDEAKNLLNLKYENKSFAGIELNKILHSIALQSLVDGRYETALMVSSQIPIPAMRAEAQAFIAEHIYKKNPDQNKQKVLAILDKSKKELEDDSKIKDKTHGVEKFLSVYAMIDSEKAFPIYDSLINQLNKINDSENTIFKELKVTEKGNISYKLGVNVSFSQSVPRLAKNDFARTLEITNKLKHFESRILVKLSLLESGNSQGQYYYYYNDDMLIYCRI